jgi:hypothetical protein
VGGGKKASTRTHSHVLDGDISPPLNDPVTDALPMNIPTTLMVVAIILSLASLIYSLSVLLKAKRPGRTSSIATSSVDPKHFLLDLIAVTEPRVKSLLSSSPDELFVSMRHVGPPVRSHHGIITAKHGDKEESVDIDLRERRDLEPLFEVLLGRVNAPHLTAPLSQVDGKDWEGQEVGRR